MSKLDEIKEVYMLLIKAIKRIGKEHNANKAFVPNYRYMVEPLKDMFRHPLFKVIKPVNDCVFLNFGDLCGHRLNFDNECTYSYKNYCEKALPKE